MAGKHKLAGEAWKSVVEISQKLQSVEKKPNGQFLVTRYREIGGVLIRLKQIR